MCCGRRIGIMRPRHEKASDQQVEPQANTGPRFPQAHELSRRAAHHLPSPAQRALATDPGLIRARSPVPVPATTRLKLTSGFRAVYRRGRWARGAALSVGVLPNRAGATRIGLRTRRGMKGAVVRNRLKRQLREALRANEQVFRPGLDIVIVLHPERLPAATALLEKELLSLCKRSGATS